MFIKKSYNHDLPLTQDVTNGGIDLSSAIKGSLSIGEQLIVPTGWEMAIPDGWVGIIKPRSGLAARFGINIGAGVIDSSYRGEVKILLYRVEIGSSADSCPFIFEAGDRVAQMVIVPHYVGKLTLTDKLLPESARGVNGFGSSGLAAVRSAGL